MQVAHIPPSQCDETRGTLVESPATLQMATTSDLVDECAPFLHVSVLVDTHQVLISTTLCSLMCVAFVSAIEAISIGVHHEGSAEYKTQCRSYLDPCHDIIHTSVLHQGTRHQGRVLSMVM